MNPRELRQSLRSLFRRPAFACTAILTIALGVGANIAVYDVIYGTLLQPLPYTDPDAIVQLWESTPALAQLQVTVPDFADWRTRTHSFQEMAAYTLAAMNHTTLLGQGEPEPLHATMAGHDLFPLLGIQPLAGRAYTAEEERARAKVGLISEALWRRKFAADPSVLGRPIRLQNETFTVIGVVSSTQAFPAWADFWMPLSLIEPELQNRRKYHPLEVLGRLAPGRTAAEAQTEIQAVARSLAAEHPDTNGTVGAYAIPLHSELTGEVRPSLLLVWAAVGLVLLIACANLAHLVLARMLERRQEMEVRAALGAGTGRLMRGILVESVVLAVMGGATGAAFAAATGRLLRIVGAGRIPQLEWAGLHGSVVFFAIAISLICGLLFGLPACWQVWRARYAEGSPGARTVVRARSRLGVVLIGAEIALAFVVVSGAVLLFRGFTALLNEDPGFRAGGVFTVQVPCNCASGQASPFFEKKLLPLLNAIPGVDRVAAANSVPLSLGRTEHSRFATRFGLEGRTFPSGQYPVAQIRWVTPDYFRVLGIPLKSGAWLTDADLDKPRFLINEALARQWFPHQEPSGRRVVLGVMDPQPTPSEIAGVVGDVRELGLDEEAPPTLYEIGASPVMNLLIESSRSPGEVFAAIRQIVHQTDPEIALGAIRPLEQNVVESLDRRRFALTLLGAFGVLAAILTAAGIYGLLAYSVNARLREMGVRAAVGATPGALLRLILREAASTAIPGIAAGLIGFLWFSRWMQSMVYQVSPLDPLSLATAAALLLAVILLSAWLPARRAARVDAATALRAD